MHTRLSIVSICRVSGWGDKLFGFRRDKAVPSPIWPGPTPLTPCCVITPCIADVFVGGVLHSSATVAHRTERDGKDRSATILHFPRSMRHLWSAPMDAGFSFCPHISRNDGPVPPRVPPDLEWPWAPVPRVRAKIGSLGPESAPH